MSYRVQPSRVVRQRQFRLNSLSPDIRFICAPSEASYEILDIRPLTSAEMLDDFDFLDCPTDADEYAGVFRS